MKVFIFIFILSFSSFASVTKTYAIPDMVCGHCEKAITKELLKIRKIKKENIQFDVQKKQVTITFEDDTLLSKAELKSIQYKAGYDLFIK